MPADVCRTLIRQRITAMAGVPPFWIQLMDRRSPFASLQFPHLRYITNTGGVFPADLVQRYRAQLPDTRIYLMYGLSEAFRSTYLPPEELERFPDSMGKAIPECEVFAVNPQGERCAAGEVGELVHRGPTVALGYWNDTQASAQVFRPDLLSPAAERNVVYSGDLVRQNEEGYFFFVGRRDEMIKSQGFRISPGEVEALARASGFISDVVVKGEPDPERGAALVMHCVPRSPVHFDSEQLLAYFRQEAPRYMLPNRVVVHKQFPRTCTGKINRAGL
jgi:acyl-CoA synthetase (AMP-forming)/AMP-acid ligase II